MNSWFSFSRGSIVAGLALAVLPLAQGKIERVVEKSFTVSATGTLRIDTSGGDIRVEPSADATTVEVIATQRFNTDSEQEADEISRETTLTIEQSGNDVNAKASRLKKTESSWFGVFNWSKNQSARVDFKVTVPAAFAVIAKTSGGDLVIGDMAGAVKVSTSGGEVRLGKLGAAVEAKTSGGDIDLEEAAGDARLDTSGGDIEAGRVGGRAELSTSGGDIEIKAAAGKISAHTSGGDVEAELDKTAAFTLDARTSGGQVADKGLAISEKERRKNRLLGAVNGGGPQLKLQSSGGDITVQAR